MFIILVGSGELMLDKVAISIEKNGVYTIHICSEDLESLNLVIKAKTVDIVRNEKLEE